MKDKILNEILASIVVFLVALPLCMGIAIASGVPPALGLITGIVGGLVVGSLAGSPLQVSGPAAGLAVLVAELVRDHGLAFLGPVLILAGLIQLIAGSLKFGQWFRAMSPAVVYGMLAGIGILIFAGQFHVMLDDKPRASGIANILAIPQAIIGGILPLDGSKHELAALLGVITIAVLVSWNLFKPKALSLIPGALVAVITATTIATVWQLPVQYVNVPQNIAEVIKWPSMETFGQMANPTLLLAGLAMAFVASAETLLSAAAVDRMHNGPRTNYDRELAAQGVGNLICGFLGSLPMTGVIVRSSANVQAGAKTRLSTILHGAWMLAFVMLIPGVLRMIPTASLAGILVFTGWKLIDKKAFRQVASYGRMPIVIYAATVIGIVSTDLLTGVLIGISLSVAKVLYKVASVRLEMDHDPVRNRADLRLHGAATFLKIPALAQALEKLPAGCEVHLHFDRLVYIDHACIDLLTRWQEQAASQGGQLIVEWEGLIARNARLGEA